jgi:2,4-dienoyl-CoA reductase-like NADH-dependent reductase (Old Yellow Enzyme family)/NADPH-dependent 2,4-dienoyl-CoA reductase/sulfur reductase-like enzyme
MKLFEPLVVKNVVLKNRIVMSPMGVSYCSTDGYVTEQMINYYVRRAQGGVGLMQIQAAAVVFPEGRPSLHHPSIDDDIYIPSLRKLCEAVRAAGEGIVISQQIQHTGPQTKSEYTGCTPVAATSISISDFYPEVPKALTIDEIHNLVKAFGNAAARVKKIGYDAVNLQFAHGYLIGSFLSPKTNLRKDEYGGNLENRMRFAKEILVKCRKTVGPDFLIIVRINCDDFIEGGQTYEESKEIALMCKEMGADIIDVSGGIRASTKEEADPTMACPRGVWVKYAQGIKEVVKETPVIVVRRITDPRHAEMILQETNIDLVALGRPFLADPDFPNKARKNRWEDIVPCIACNQGCYDRLFRQESITCLVNPTVGMEKEYEFKPAEKKKNVLVIGGGPAGLETARVASLRGHEVSLYEKENCLGGQLKLAGIPSFKREIGNLLSYFENQMRKLGVSVQLNTEVTEELLKKLNPEVIVVATGSRPAYPSIFGMGGKNVFSAWDVLTNKDLIKGDSVIVIGGGKVGCEVAEFIADGAKKVKIVEMLEDIGVDMGRILKKFTKFRLSRKNVEVITGTKILGVTDEGVIGNVNGIEKLIVGDNIVLATGAKSDPNIVSSLVGKGKELYIVGDCVTVGDALSAIHAGFHIGRIV